MNKTLKTILSILLALLCVFLVYKIYDGVMEPVRFEKDVNARKKVAIQQLKDIRDLQVAYKSVNDRFTASFDTLKQFYKNGEMVVLMQIGSKDDSLAWENTQKITGTREFKKLSKPEQDAKFLDLYRKGEKLVFSISTPIAVKDTLFNNRPDFCPDSLKYIPFSGKQLVETDAIIKTVSGVQVPLFEARMPWKALLKGMDNQLRINLDAESRDMNRYEGLQVGSITAPNNNAGNWE